MEQKIGVFDSGIGGLTTLKEIKKMLPNESFIYYADHKNNPYGEKTEDALYKIVTNIVEYLISENVKLIVIACNTATTKCIKKLRKDYPKMMFVGTEPALKVAFDNGFKKTVLLSTPATASSDRVKELIKRFKRKNEEIEIVPCKGLAHAIETKDKETTDKLLHKYLDKHTDANAIVLGCTHYPLAKKEIKKIVPNATIIDGNLGVAKRVKFLLKENKILNKNKIKGRTKIIENK